MTRDDFDVPALLQTALSKSLQFTVANASPFPNTGCLIFRGPKPARLFNTKNDWLVYLTGRAQDRSFCGSGQGDANISLAWKDSTGNSSPASLDLKLTNVNISQITVADVDRDGYADVVVSDGYKLFIYNAKDVDDPAAGLQLAQAIDFPRHPNGVTLDLAGDHEYGQVAIGDFNGDGALDIVVPVVTIPDDSYEG